VTFSAQKHEAVDSDWQQLEDFVDQLHELARTPVETAAFYRRLLDGCVESLAAVGGAVWLPDACGRWVLVQQTNLASVIDRKDASAVAAHNAILQSAAGEARVFSPRSGMAATGENPTDSVLVVAAVCDDRPRAVVELFMRTGSSPAVQQGWQEFLATVCEIAGNFHAHHELRSLRADHDLHDQSLALLKRVHKSTDLRKTAFEIANEGRRFVKGDRLSVLVRRGRSWRLLAVSGVDRVEMRGDTSKRLQMLAKKTALWGEPIDYAEAASDDGEDIGRELPPELAALVEQHVDQSHARRLVAVPFEFADDAERAAKRRKPRTLFSAVLIAEQFSAATQEFSCQRVIELAALCEPALRLATRFDRFPMRSVVCWSQRLARLASVDRYGLWRLLWLIFAGAVVAGIVGALVYVPYDFEIEAPATLMPVVERDIFATTSGTLTEVRVAHGDRVQAGDVVAVILDPELTLDEERVQGEIEIARRRMEAIAVARTARIVREDTAEQRLPLSADGLQLEKKLASLMRQQEILAARREALALRSPIAGTVLTLDVQKLLRSRPVERGQVLFTVADPSSGWRLVAEVSQRAIGHVLAAEEQTEGKLPVRFRLAGDDQGVYAGHLESVTAVAVLDTTSLEGDAPAIRVEVTVDEKELPTARPGMTAQVRFDCGSRPLGYVWLHDVWETVYSWVVF